MYNTMYGGNGTTTQGKAGPIHIKIEDQTGINSGGKFTNIQNTGQPNTIPSTTTKKQFQQTAQKFGNAIKAQHNVSGNVGMMNKSGAKSFARKKSKAGLNPISNTQTVQTVVQSGNTTSKNQSMFHQKTNNLQAN